MPVTAASLKARGEAITTLYHERGSFTREAQEQALAELLPVLEEELGLDEAGTSRVRAFLEDRPTVFRFCRRARFSFPAALKLLHATLAWRLTSSLSQLTPAALSPLYLTHPLFFFHPDLFDKFGRPAAVLNLRHVARTPDGELEGLKEFIRLGWEIGRRWLSDLSKEGEEEVKIQMVVIVDLEGAGMSNLEVELLPFFMDLLKNHFPGMVGAIFVLNYGWMYSGMWQLSKRVLPNTALERILFPTKVELLEFFEESHLLKEHGGTVEYTYSPSNPILVKYGRPSASSAYPSPSPSRNVSSDSLSTDYHSLPGTPHIPHRSLTPNSSHSNLSRRPSRLSMTNLRSGRSSASDLTDRGGAWSDKKKSGKSPETESTIRRVTSFAELQERLAETQKAIESDDSSEAEEEMVEAEDGLLEEEEYEELLEDTGDTNGLSSARTSAFSSRANSRTGSRTHSRDGSPIRKRGDGEAFSTRAVRFSGRNHISPYNISNPFYGYPAFVPPSDLDPTGVPRPHYHRRRKRDLVRTLTYLAVLRFLSIHRTIQWRLSALFAAFLRLTHLYRGTEKHPTKVHWQTEASTSTGILKAPTQVQPASQQHQGKKSRSRMLVDVRVVYFLLAIIVLRSPSFRRCVRFLVLDLPATMLPYKVKSRGRQLLNTTGLRGIKGQGRKRDVVTNFMRMGWKGVGTTAT